MHTMPRGLRAYVNRRRQLRLSNGVPPPYRNNSRTATIRHAKNIVAQKKQNKMAYSYTRTNTESKVKTIKSGGGHISKSDCVVQRKKMKGFDLAKKIHVMDHFVQTGASGATSGYGAQGIANMNFQCTAGDLYSMYERAITTTTGFNSAALVNLYTVNKRLWQAGVESTSLISNASASAGVLYIYDLLCRQDRADSPTFSWEAGLDQASGLQLVNHTMFNCKPTQSPSFNRQWKVLKCTRVELPTGATHQHFFKHKLKTMVPFQKVWDYNNIGGLTTIKGFTTCQMIVWHGIPGDSVTTAAIGPEITLDNIKLLWITEEKSYSIISDIKGKKITQQDNIEKNPERCAVQNPDGQGVHDSVANLVEAITAFS